MTILLTEPHCPVGRLILRDLLAPEFSVRVLTVVPESLPEVVQAEAEIIEGSPADPSTLRKALEGVEALFWNATRPPPQPSAILESVRRRGVRRIVSFSSTPSNLWADPLTLADWKKAEAFFAKTDLNVRRVRCGWLMENLLAQSANLAEQNALTFPAPADQAIPLTAAADAADLVLQWLVRRDWTGNQAIRINPASWLSGYQAARIVEQLSERPVRCLSQAGPDSGLPHLAADLRALQAKALVEFLGSPSDTHAQNASAMTQPSAITTFEDWAERVLLPAAEVHRRSRRPATAKPVI